MDKDKEIYNKPLTIEKLKILKIGEEELQANLEKAYEHNEEECKRCMSKVEAKQSLLLDETEKHVRQKTAKEILSEVLECCRIELSAAKTDKFDNMGDRYWDGKISGVMNTRADIIEVAKKYGVEVEE